jgi:hypothetical protein
MPWSEGIIFYGMIVHTALDAARAMLHALGKGPGHWMTRPAPSVTPQLKPGWTWPAPRGGLGQPPGRSHGASVEIAHTARYGRAPDPPRPPASGIARARAEPSPGAHAQRGRAPALPLRRRLPGPDPGPAVRRLVGLRVVDQLAAAGQDRARGADVLGVALALGPPWSRSPALEFRAVEQLGVDAGAGRL